MVRLSLEYFKAKALSALAQNPSSMGGWSAKKAREDYFLRSIDAKNFEIFTGSYSRFDIWIKIK